MTESRSVLYLGASDIAALDIDPADTRAAIRDAFRAYHGKRAVSLPKAAIEAGPGHVFQSMCAASIDIGLAGNKWLGFVPAPPGTLTSPIDAIIALNDYVSGRLVAILDGNLITGIRTAAMSAFAASSLARSDSRTIGFVGCGLQARTHLDAMKSLLPGLDIVQALGCSRDSTRRFVDYAEGLGFTASCTDDAAALVGSSDVVVTSVPMRPGLKPFLDADWIAPGAFVASVDVGRCWHPEGLRRLDILATDDHDQQAHYPITPEVGPLGTFDVDFADLAVASSPVRANARQRAMLIYRGFALADLAVAALVLERARAQGRGMPLPR